MNNNNRSAIGKHIKACLEDVRKRGLSPRTIDTYGRAMRDCMDFLISRGKTRPRNITTQDLVDYRLSLVERGFKPSSMQTYIRSVRLLFQYLEDTRSIFLNPTQTLDPVRRSRDLMPAPSLAEVIQLLESEDVSTAVGVRNRAMLEVLYGSGLRKQELVSLRCRDVDFADSQIRVLGKGNKERIVPLTSAAMEWLRTYIEEAREKLLDGNTYDSLWISCHKKPACGPTVNMIFRNARERMNFKTHITPHSLRRACATHLLQNGASPLDIQMLLGHSSLRHLSQYLHLTITELKKAHEESEPGT